MLAVFDMIEEEKGNSYNDGVREGKREGKNEGIKMLAKRMLAMKMDIDKIVKITGLEEKEIKKIK